MPVAAGDLKYYGSANMPLVDTGTAGGAIDTAVGIIFDDISAADTLEVLSSNAGDTTQTITVTGRNAAGEILTAGPTSLNGTTQVNLSGTFERIIRAVLSATTAGTVTLRKASDNVTIMTFPPGMTQIRRPFYNVAADASGGSARTFYEKIFVKNTHGTLTLTSATIAEQADPSAKVTFALDNALDGTTTSTNRVTAPASGTGSFDGTTKNVVNSQNLTAGAAQGIWLKLDLAAGDAGAKSSYTLRTSGQTV